MDFPKNVLQILKLHISKLIAKDRQSFEVADVKRDYFMNSVSPMGQSFSEKRTALQIIDGGLTFLTQKEGDASSCTFRPLSHHVSMIVETNETSCEKDLIVDLLSTHT